MKMANLACKDDLCVFTASYQTRTMMCTSTVKIYINYKYTQMMLGHTVYTHTHRGLSAVRVEDQNTAEGSHTLLRFHVSTPGR